MAANPCAFSCAVPLCHQRPPSATGATREARFDCFGGLVVLALDRSSGWLRTCTKHDRARGCGGCAAGRAAVHDGLLAIGPLVTLSLGVSLEMGKLRTYPISMGSLFVVECLLRLGTGSEMVLLLAGLFGGLAYADSPYLAQLGGAFVLFVAFNVFFSAGMRNLVERVFRRRRLREVVLVGSSGFLVGGQRVAGSSILPTRRRPQSHRSPKGGQEIPKYPTRQSGRGQLVKGIRH